MAQDYEAHGIPLWAMDFGPLDSRFFLAAGKPDFNNRHLSTVVVTTLGPLEAAQCSGILLAPRVILTAASCVCTPREISTPEGGKGTVIDGSSCAERVYVATVAYGKALNESMAPMEIHSYSGVARPHPDFELLLDGQSVVTHRADLAVIVLNSSVKGDIPTVPFSDQEARAGESLLMVGYGYGEKIGQIYGLRFIRRDTVLRAWGPGRDRFLYEQQGTYLYDGFKGGPCLREQREGYRLVGVASVGTEKELSFTSTYAYRDWLTAELQQVSRQVPASKKLP